MANNNLIKEEIKSIIKNNGVNEITGDLSQQSLLAIINHFGTGSLFLGLASPETVPIYPDVNGFYIAVENGIYSNFNGYENTDNKFIVFSNKNGSYEKIFEQYQNVTNVVNNITIDPDSIVPSEALYNDNDNTVAVDISKRIDINTKKDINYIDVLNYENGDVMDDSKVDGVIYIKKDNVYKRLVSNEIDVRWFGAKGDTDANDIGTDDTNAIQLAIDTAHKIYKKSPLSGGAVTGGVKVILGRGKFKITETLILKTGVLLIGESDLETHIHCATNFIAITNVEGYEQPSGDIISAKNIKIKGITITQGGIQLIQCWHSYFENIRIIGAAKGIEIQIPVDLYFFDIKVRQSDTGIEYKDFAGTGPSTTVFFDKVYTSWCYVGIVIDGNTGGSHGIIASSFSNIVSEYNTYGIRLFGKIEQCTFKTVHLEQNTNTSLEISGDINATFIDVWDDTQVGTKIAKSTNSNLSNLTFINHKSILNIFSDYDGKIYLLGQYNLPGYPNTCQISFPFGAIGQEGSLPENPIVGYSQYITNKSKPAWYDGQSWRGANGFNINNKTIGGTAERPTQFLDNGFVFFDTNLKKPIWMYENNWYDANGQIV